METISIAQPDKRTRDKIAQIAEQLSSESCADRLAVEAELNDRVAALYGLTADERRILERRATSNNTSDPTEDE